MATRLSQRLVKPLLIATGATAVAGTVIYVSYRPRDIPGTQAATVPPPSYGEGGTFRPPRFPRIKTREEQIEALRAHSKPESSTGILSKLGFGGKEEEGGTEEYDLIIIGGGATGSGIALDAATRGLKVAVVERDDFGSGTSSKSTKLVHGGVRYLEKAVWDLDYNQYKLVREALRERKYFLDIAPHLSFHLPIMLPIYSWWKAPYYWAGTKCYDFLAGADGIESAYFLTKSRALDAFPMLQKQGLVGALVYYDGMHNDSRMNTGLAVTASLYGATVVNHMEVTDLEKDADGKVCGVKVRDLLPERDGKKAKPFSVSAKGVINATGPFTDGVRKMDNPEVKEIVAPSAGTHVILPGYYSPARMGLIDPSTSDGRVIFFLPWQGNTIAGTTDKPTTVTPNPCATEEEVDWILSEIRRYLNPDMNVRRGDVLAAWTGIRPLVRDPKAKNTESLVRNHLIDISDSGLITVAGGKWTTYREMAEEAVDIAVSHYRLAPRPVTNAPRISGTEMVDDGANLDGTCQSHRVKLLGAHGYSRTLFINLIQHFGVETEVAKHLTDSYGDRAWTVAALSAPTDIRFPARGIRLSTLYPFVDGEVRYAVRHEYARTAVDVLARRTRLAFLNAQAALEALPGVIDIMGEELHWDGRRKQREWRDTVGFLASMGLPATKAGVTRRDVETGRASRYQEGEYRLYARHDGPTEELASDQIFGENESKVVPDQAPETR